MVRVRHPVRRVVIGAGALLLLAGVLWRPVAAPLLVRFPTDLDQTATYEGTFTVHVDPATGTPLASPTELPLALERRILTVPGSSSARTVIVQELVTFRIAGIEQHESHQYVMDRRSMANRDDARSYSYDPAHVVRRDGTYRVNLPLGVEPDGHYRIWENEPGRSFAMDGLARRVERDGLTLFEMEEVFHDVPVDDYYRGELRKQGFALEIGFDALVARLQRTGVDVDAALAALPATEAAAIADARSATLPLRFFRDNDGHALVEPRTGAIVDLLVSDEGITATTDLTPIAPLRDALARNADRPAVAALASALDDVASASPSAVYDLHYSQTAASVSEMIDLTKEQVRALALVEDRAPAVLVGAGVLLLVGAVLGPRAQALRSARQDAGREARSGARVLGRAAAHQR